MSAAKNVVKGDCGVNALTDKRLHRMDIAAVFGENLVRYRKAAKLSQEELAFHASLHRTEIGQLERGVRLARVDTLLKLAGALAIRPEQLLHGVGWDPGVTRRGNFIPARPEQPAEDQAPEEN